MLASYQNGMPACFSAKREHPAIKEVCARRCIAMRSADEQQLALIRPRRTPALPVAHLRLALPALSAGPIGPHGAAVDAPIAPALWIGRPDDLPSCRIQRERSRFIQKISANSTAAFSSKSTLRISALTLPWKNRSVLVFNCSSFRNVSCVYQKYHRPPTQRHHAQPCTQPDCLPGGEAATHPMSRCRHRTPKTAPVLHPAHRSCHQAHTQRG